jgi:hypothetical protein
MAAAADATTIVGSSSSLVRDWLGRSPSTIESKGVG